VHHDDPGFGHRFIAEELNDAGHRARVRVGSMGRVGACDDNAAME